jgi:hypothetical protein
VDGLRKEAMSRTLSEIIAHLRAVCENPSVSTTLIQTEDLMLLCNEIERTRKALTAISQLKREKCITADADTLFMILEHKVAIANDTLRGTEL